jgi:tetratricopeptide (TPR) repeat protein
VSSAPPALEAALASRYRLVRELGRGGMATVYLAEDLRHRRQVAIKVLNPELAATLGPERFLREIEIAAGLDHPHILPLYDSGDAGGFLYYVMPYVEGASLRDRLNREKQLPVDDALALAREVADALSCAHGQGVVHRDIKPENIMLAGGHARVADFGIARAIDAAGGDRLTATGLALGTPAYMSPEQALGDTELDGRSDLYSLGCVLYEMLCGVPPFTGPTVESVVRQHLTAEPTPVTTHRPAVPSSVAAALARALAKTPADRFSPVAQFAEALRAPAATTGVAQAPAVPARRRWHPRTLAVAALVLVAVGVAGVRALGPGRGGTLIGTGVLAERARFILADLDNRTQDPTLGATVTELLRVGLSQSTAITVLDPVQVVRLLELMRREPTGGVPVPVAMEAAERGGLAGVVTGEVRQVGNSLTVSARLVTPGGDVLVLHQETTPDADGLVAAVDRLSNQLRRRVGETLGSIRRNPPLDQVTTASLPALRLYAQGMQASNQGEDVRALSLFEEAVAADSAFGMAWRKMAIILSNLGEQRARSVEAALKAYENRDRLTDRERLAVTAAYHSVVTGNRDQVIAAYRTLLDIYPDDYLALNNIAVIYGQLRDYRRAAEFYERALVTDSTVRLHYSNLSSSLQQLGMWDSALKVLARYEANFPGNPEVLIARIIYAANRKDYDQAAVLGDSLMASQRGVVAWEALAYEWLASLAALQGRLDLAHRHWARSLGLTAERRLPGAVLTRTARRAITETLLTEDPSAGQRLLDEALARYPLRTLSPLDRPYPMLAMAYAAVGKPDVAEQLLAEHAATPEADHAREALAWADGARGVVALARGRPDEALGALRRFDEQGNCATCAAAWLARAWDRAGQPDSAAAAYEHLVTRPSAAVWYDAGHLAHGYRRLGDFHEQRGDRERAVEYYAKVADMWAGADPQFQPVVRQAREALARLAAEPAPRP